MTINQLTPFKLEFEHILLLINICTVSKPINLILTGYKIDYLWYDKGKNRY